MSKKKDPDDPFVAQADNLDVDEFDDELNDETFGDPINDDAEDWETAQDLHNDKVETCIKELQKAVGDKIPEIDLKIAASTHNYNFEQALNALLADEQRNNQRKANGQSKHTQLPQHNPIQIENSLLPGNEESLKNSLERVAAQQQFNQMQYQMMQQQIRNQMMLMNHPQLNQYHEMQPPLYNHLNSQQFIPPHIQQLIQQQQASNGSLSSSSLSDSFASMNLNTFNHVQNGFELNPNNLTNLSNHNNLSNLNNLSNFNNFSNLNNVNNNLSDFRNNFLMKTNPQLNQLNQQLSQINQQMSQQINKSDFLNGHVESTPAKRALTLEEIEQGLLHEKKETNEPQTMILQDTENSFLSDRQSNSSEQSAAFGFNINNLTEFPQLNAGDFPKITKTMHEAERPAQQQFNNMNSNSRSNYKNYNNTNRHNQNYNNQQHYNSRDRNQLLTRDYHPSLIPNPLNPLEMIKNENQMNRTGYNNKPHHKNYNNPHNYQKMSGYNNYYPIRTDDEYAGLMTPKDINWLRRIQHMQLEFDDPYVQDYYFVNYQTRKIAAELKKRDKINGEMHNVPQLVIPERSIKFSSNESTIGENPRYIPPDFSGSLGKIRVANVNYPRKLLDFNNKLEKLAAKSESVNIEPHGRTELNKFRRLLLDIERNLTNVLKIDHEDKKMAALPPEAQIAHLEERKRLCNELFEGILTTEDNQSINFNIANIRKGCMLIFKALQVLEDPKQKTVIISDLLKVDNFHYVVMQKDKTLYCLDYGQVLIDAIKTIKDCDFALLLRIADGLDDASVVAKFQCGQEIIEVLLNQYIHFDVKDKNQKLKWLAFLERVLEDVDDIPHLRKLCNDHIVALIGQK